MTVKTVIDAAGIGARVVRAREALGLSRGDLARAAGVDWRTLYRIERGENAPSVGTLQAIAARCAVTIDQLVVGPAAAEPAKVPR